MMSAYDRRASAARRHREALRAVGLEKDLGVSKQAELTEEQRADVEPACLCPGSTPWLSRHLDRPWPDEFVELRNTESRTCFACGATKSRPKVQP